VTYEIWWTEHPASKFEKLEKAAQERLIERLESAAENPFIVAKRLKGSTFPSIRAGDYTIIVSMENKIMLIIVLEVGQTIEIYQKY
jgi:mRNA-degrading endonuclease RelE of RelBE toxin-antitoxin system